MVKKQKVFKPKLKPLYPQVLVRPLYEEISENVIIPDWAKKQPQKGTVIKLSEGISEVSVGDKILWKELSGTYIDDLILVDLNDILLKF